VQKYLDKFFDALQKYLNSTAKNLVQKIVVSHFTSSSS
jgi:hypothetical protein